MLRNNGSLISLSGALTLITALAALPEPSMALQRRHTVTSEAVNGVQIRQLFRLRGDSHCYATNRNFKRAKVTFEVFPDSAGSPNQVTVGPLNFRRREMKKIYAWPRNVSPNPTCKVTNVELAK